MSAGPVDIVVEGFLTGMEVARIRLCGSGCAPEVRERLDEGGNDYHYDAPLPAPAWCQACGEYIPGAAARHVGDVSTPMDSVGWYVAHGDSILRGPLPDLLDAIDAPRTDDPYLDLARVMVAPERRTYDSGGFTFEDGPGEPMARFVAAVLAEAQGVKDALGALERARQCLARASSLLPHLPPFNDGDDGR